MAKKQKLELTWIGKEYWPKRVLRIFLEALEQNYDKYQGLEEDTLLDSR